MNNATSAGTAPFLLVTLDGFALRRRDSHSGEYLDARLGEKPSILLAFLALVHAAVPRALLCDLLWTGRDGSRARNSLRQAIFRIRRVLGDHAIAESALGVVLAPGLIEIDLIRALQGAPAEEREAAGSRLTADFGRVVRPVGRSFNDWRSRVRRQLAKGELHSAMLRGASSTAPEPAESSVGSSSRTELTSHRLAQLFRLSLQGIPLVVWAMGRPEAEVRRGVEEFAASCQAQGASLAAVPRRVGAGYVRFALERELAEVLWPLPGAAGIKPDLHDALVRLQRGIAVESQLLRDAIVDLIAAISENGPLVITLGDPGRYSLGALTALIAELTALRDRPVLLVVAEHSGVRPVHSSCIEVHVGSAHGPAHESKEQRISA